MCCPCFSCPFGNRARLARKLSSPGWMAPIPVCRERDFGSGPLTLQRRRQEPMMQQPAPSAALLRSATFLRRSTTWPSPRLSQASRQGSLPTLRRCEHGGPASRPCHLLVLSHGRRCCLQMSAVSFLHALVSSCASSLCSCALMYCMCVPSTLHNSMPQKHTSMPKLACSYLQTEGWRGACF